MNTLTFAQLVRLTAEENGLTLVDAKALLLFVFRTVASAVRSGRRVTVPDFGAFSMRTRKARRILTPAGEPMNLPQTRTIGFRAFKRDEKRGAP